MVVISTNPSDYENNYYNRSNNTYIQILGTNKYRDITIVKYIILEQDWATFPRPKLN